MKTFEERYTAWIDGRLAGAELTAFEQELAAHPEAEGDRREAHRLGDLLRLHGAAPALGSGDFFNSQLLEKIAYDERPPVAPERRSMLSWLFPHVAWGGVCCLLVSALIYREWVAPSQQSAATASPRANPFQGEVLSAKYDASVLGAEPGEGVYATPVQSKKDGVTVVWLDGLDYLPASYQLQ